jgi:type VI secretion system secreted protein VgrG
MSKEILTDISIEGKKITHFSSIIISQQFNSHHTFQLIASHDVFESLGSHSIQSSQDFIGKRISIAFGEKSTDDNAFKGVITEVGMQHSQGLWGNVILKGYSPTFLMEGGNHNDSYYKKSLDAIVKSITGKLSVHDMRLNIKPAYTKTLDYTCQYNESHFAFVNRLAAEYGEWFYYDGENLFFGNPGKADKVELLYGENVEDISFAMRVVPTNVAHYSYNSAEDKLNKANSPGSVDGSNDYMKKALDASDQLFKNGVSQSSEIRTPDKQQLDEHAKKGKGVKAASTVLLTAHGDSPKVKLGCHVDLKIAQKETKGTEAPVHGEYLVTGITHHLSGTGEYTNTFEGIPSDNTYIPFTTSRPMAETQMAIVKDNADPDNMGRVRVQMIWQEKKGELTDWIRVLTPDAGSSDTVSKNRGFVFIPEVGDQVFVAFRYNDPNRPFVLGSMFHGKIAEGGGIANNSKTIQTRSGHRIELNDAAGGESITITDKHKNSIVIDTVENSMDIRALNTITISAMHINLIAGSTVNVNAVASYNLNTMNCMSNVSKGTILRTKDLTNMVAETYSSSATTINQTAKKDINSKAKEKIIISAKNKLDQRAGAMDVSTSKGKLRLKSNSDTEIKGKQVKTN